MFKKLNIDLIYRFIGLILFSFSIWYIDNFYILLFLYLLLFVINYKYNPLIIFMLIFTLLFVLTKYENNLSKILNIILIIDYVTMFIFYLKKEDIISFKNNIFKKKFTYRGLSKEYYNDIKNENDKRIQNIITSNSLIDDVNINEIKTRMYSKNKVDVFDKLCINYIRFYKNQNDRYKYFGFNQLTLIYLSIHVIVLITAVVIK